jgi:uncharacterized membrane protein
MNGLGDASYYQNLGFGALQKVAQMQQQREQFNSQASAQHKQNIMGGAASGAAIGSEIMPGWGTVIGGVVGALGGSFL